MGYVIYDEMCDIRSAYHLKLHGRFIDFDEDDFWPDLACIIAPSRLLFEHYRRVFIETDYDASMSVILYRGGQTEFDLGVKYCGSTDPDDRIVGVQVLGELGAFGKPTFVKESVDVLLDMMDDRDLDVVSSAAVALGHRADPRAIPKLIERSAHFNPDIRESVAWSLYQFEDEAVIKPLIRLSEDISEDVREWATAGLASKVEMDLSEIVEALNARLEDECLIVRGAALCGFIECGDPDIVNKLIAEWDNYDVISLLSIDAARQCKRPELLEYLDSFLELVEDGSNPSMLREIQNAIKACGGEVRSRLRYTGEQ